ncbi:carboxymuconolactone decarboxylase family protein [Pseudoalteromonas ruthenica]|uniref:carboxymuconolactone decarboxylase family protein n=1 Tax=Pseudoalteromonas ruthenica TaxID=151081 RepID=UPI00110B7283|nr:carboxymuconolactone decarboxylase family protein [Pseudoalteromonas ruthenica]TMO46143.1 alkylhydroperoxidase [Pseudoalteromonas ruthenica]TMO51564.1 alkylhydroperoxidase [Pseudoalteromonas ruthenica]
MLSQQQLYQLLPQLPEALMAMTESAEHQLEPELIHMVRLRVSAINGCRFCIAMHTREAQQSNITEATIAALLNSPAASTFTATQWAALQWAEALTVLGKHEQLGESMERLQAHYNTEQIVALCAVIIQINGWNRVAIGFDF